MAFFSLKDFLDRLWYTENIVVKDGEQILYSGRSFKLQSTEDYKSLGGKWVKSYGTLDGKIIINII